jgi:hypothetical protein
MRSCKPHKLTKPTKLTKPGKPFEFSEFSEFRTSVVNHGAAYPSKKGAHTLENELGGMHFYLR